MSVMVTSVGNAWFLARWVGGAAVPFGRPYASLRVACKAAARINRETGQ